VRNHQPVQHHRDGPGRAAPAQTPQPVCGPVGVAERAALNAAAGQRAAAAASVLVEELRDRAHAAEARAAAAEARGAEL